jgi:Raf kinase inhibitor-like YbhB/YbcL family protein
MSEFYISCILFEEGGEMPEELGYKHGNMEPSIQHHNLPENYKCQVRIMDDPDAMEAVGKVWVHDLRYINASVEEGVEGKNDFGELGWGGPAPPDKPHTYVFKAYVLDVELDLKEGYSKQELEDAMKGHILAEAKLTGTYAP